VVPRWDPARVLDLIEAHRITTLNLIPTLLNELIQVQQQQPRDVSSLRLLTVAGSVLTEATYVQARDLFGEVIGNVYGLTELAGPVTFLLPHHMASGLHRSVGLPGQAIQMARLDAQGQPQRGPGQGELLLGGDQVTSGYWRDPQASAQAMLGPWFRTGDEVRIDEDGFVYIVDRIKDMIKTGGLNVFPSEVEEVLYTHPAVMEAAVFGLPDPRWSEAVHAAVVLKPGQAATAADLQAHCRQHLAAHKAPKQVHFLSQLPRTRFGKFDKAALRQQLAAAP
jgi:acyl-CoA synthetase (AMP-forming)/AMP-acid ligase II